MTAPADATISAVELRVLDRFVRLLEDDLGADLRSVWLFGSRARGEEPGESDVDVLVVATRATLDDHFRVAQRRAIRSFFVEEVDRDKVGLAGDP